MVFKDGTFFCQLVNIGRENILSAIESTICIAKVIDQQKNNVGLFALAMGLVDSFETTKVNELDQEQQTMENWQLAVQAFCRHYGYAALIAILLCLCH
jgi:citrate lyase beta subunit